MKGRIFMAYALLLTACAALSLAGEKADANKNLFQEYVEKFGSPGPEHKLLEPLVGSWHAKVTTWLDPGRTPQTSDGTVQRRSIMGGRFIQETCEGKMMDKPYEGLGTIGYDRAKKRFVSSWIDSMTTAIHLCDGTYDESSKTWTFKHEGECPVTGKHARMRNTLRIVSADEQRMEMFKQLGDAKEVKTMEIVLTRNK